MSCLLQQVLDEARALNVFMNEKNTPLRHWEKLLCQQNHQAMESYV